MNTNKTHEATLLQTDVDFVTIQFVVCNPVVILWNAHMVRNRTYGSTGATITVAGSNFIHTAPLQLFLADASLTTVTTKLIK